MKTPKQRVDELKYANDSPEARAELYRMIFDTERDVRAVKDGPVVGWVIDAAREVLRQLHESGRAEINFISLSNAIAALDGRTPGSCHCAETYPQLMKGRIAHGPGCPRSHPATR